MAITARLPKQHFSLPEAIGGVRVAERSETFRSDSEGFLYALAREPSPGGPERRNCAQDPGICQRRSAFSNRASMFPSAEVVFTAASCG